MFEETDAKSLLLEIRFINRIPKNYVCNSTIGPQFVGASVNPIPVVNIFGGNPHSY